MLDSNRKCDDFGNQAIQNRTKTPLLFQKENSNRTFQPARPSRYQATPYSVVDIKTKIMQTTHFSPELKNIKKKRKKKSLLTLKHSPPRTVNKEIKEIENSLCRLTKKLEKERREEVTNDTNESSESSKAEQILSVTSSTAASINYKLNKNPKDFSKRKHKVIDSIPSVIQKYTNQQEIYERSRVKNSLEPIRPLISDNKTGLVSLSNNRSLQCGIGYRKLKKIHQRLDRVREFLKSINAMEIKPSICSDGINHKDTPPKKNSSPNLPEGADTNENDHYRNIQNIVKARRILNRNRLFASRPPLLETVIEEPEKEEEEAKLYEML